MTTRPLLTSIIGGSAEPAGRRVVTRMNPARAHEIAARWSPATGDQARAALDAAVRAFPAWSQLSPAERGKRLRAGLEAVERRSEDLAACITRENGKTLAEAGSEVQAGLAEARYLLEQAVDRPLEERVSATSWVAAEPVGPFLLITPWNFPLATILRKLVPALAYGNTAVLKGSELTPGPVTLVFRALLEADLPPGAANLVLGFGREIGDDLLRHPRLRGLSFTGSTRVGLELARSAAGCDVRLQLEMGGKNTVVVLADADLDLAVRETARGAFSCAGQWCTGTSRIVVDARVEEEFCARFAAQAAALRVGPGDQPDIDMGPVATEARVGVALEAVSAAAAAGARVLAGGRRPEQPKCADGHFVEPTVLTGMTDGMPGWNEELFAPVVAIARADGPEHAIQLANTGEYGLSASVFSSDTGQALRLARSLEAGMVHVNLHTAHRDSALPVGGWRNSGRGLPECGRFTRDFFTRPRAVYVHP